MLVVGVVGLAFLVKVVVGPWVIGWRDRVELRGGHVVVYTDGRRIVSVAIADIERCVLVLREVWPGVGVSVVPEDEVTLVIFGSGGRVEQFMSYRRGFWRVLDGLRKSGVIITEERVQA